MGKGQIVAAVLLLASTGAAAQAIYPDRDVNEGRVYSYKAPDGVMHYVSSPPKNGAYRAIPYATVTRTSRIRMNGLLCESDCSGERQAYLLARDRKVTNESDCPLSPRTASAGCRLWVQEGK